MRTHLIVLFILFPLFVAQSQTSSTRLSGMGNLSIAVVDTESEPFSNPAKAGWLSTGVLRINPYYYGASNDFSDHSTPGNAGFSSSNTSSSASNHQYGLPVGVIVPISNFRLGAAASAERLSSHDESITSTTGGYPQSTKSSDDTKTPFTSLALLASVELGWGSVGVLGSWNGYTQETTSRSEDLTSAPANSNESTYQDAVSNHSYGLGVLFGAAQSAQFSLTLATEGSHYESKPTSSSYNGIPDVLSQPDIGYRSEKATSFIAEVRKALEGNILAAIRIGYRGSGDDQSEKYTWYDQGAISPVYEERKTSHTDGNEYRFGVGLSKVIEGAGLFSVEYVYAPQNASSEGYEGSSGTYPDGRTYTPGSVYATSEDKTTVQEVRIGAELQITPVLVARGGLEVMWAKYGSTSRYEYDLSTSDMNGETDATYYGAGGFSYYVGPIRIDYSFGMMPYYWYLPSSSYPYSSSSSLRDILLRHSAMVSMQF